jgi:hypothetical protein
LKLKGLSKIFLKSSRFEDLAGKENGKNRLRKYNNEYSKYYFYLIFRCFIIQLFKYDEMFDAFGFAYNKKNLDNELNIFLKKGFFEGKEEDILKKLVIAINY